MLAACWAGWLAAGCLLALWILKLGRNLSKASRLSGLGQPSHEESIWIFDVNVQQSHKNGSAILIIPLGPASQNLPTGAGMQGVLPKVRSRAGKTITFPTHLCEAFDTVSQHVCIAL